MAGSECGYQGSERRAKCDYAEAAAEAVVHKTLLTFGFDINKSDDIKRLQKLIGFLESMANIAGKGLMATIAVIAAFVAGAFTSGVRETFLHWLGK